MATWQDFAAQYGSGPLGALSGVHNSKLFDTMAGQIANAIGYTGQTWTPGTYQFENANEGGTFTETAQGKQASPDFLKALEAFQFDRTGPTQGAISQGGQNVGTFTAGNKDTGFDKFANVAVPVALAAIGGQLAGGLLSGGAGEVAAGSGVNSAAGFNAAMDSQLASSQLGITGAQSAAAATVPSAVNLGSLGGIMSTAAPMSLEALRAAELAGYSSSGAMPGSAAVAQSGGLLGNMPLVGDAAKWMKDNPLLGRLVMSGATSLLSGTGGGSSGGSGASMPVDPVKWNSPIQQGLLAPVQQYAPAAIQQQRPAGLLAQGNAGDGAWRYLKG